MRRVLTHLQKLFLVWLFIPGSFVIVVSVGALTSVANEEVPPCVEIEEGQEENCEE